MNPLACRTLSRRLRPTRLELVRLEDRNTPSLFTGSSQVNTTPLTPPADAVQSVNATSANGQSVIVWTQVGAGGRRDLFAQLYKPDRTKLGGNIVVANAFMDEFDPSVSMDGSGNFVVAWTVLVGTENRNIQACRFSNTGGRLGAIFPVSALATKETESSVARAANGDFVVSYTIELNTTTGITARRYSAAGALQGAFVVVAPVANLARSSSVARNASGQFAIAYEVGNNIFLKRYSAAAAVVGVHTIANSPQAETLPSVDIANNGNCVVAWESGHDSQNYPGIFKRGVTVRTVSAAGLLGTPSVVWRGEQYTIEGESVGDDVIRPMVAMNRTTGAFVVVAEYKGAGYSSAGTNTSTSVLVAEMNANATVRIRHSITIQSYEGFEGGAELRTTFPAVTVGSDGFYFVSFVGYDPTDVLNGTATLRRRSGRLA